MKRFGLALILSLSACAGLSGPPRPDRAGITGDTLSVGFTDGRTCTATVGATGGEGVFDGCGGAAWALTIAKRNPLEPVLGSAVDPYAEVVVTTADGASRRFLLPVSREPGFDAIRIE